ncbi:MAG: calcium-translocating P-type ATPase, PMCA-type [Rikenellaceae bacterium]
MYEKKYIGLTNQEVSRSREIHGDNTLTPPPKKSLWVKFIEKFYDPIIIILLVALALSVGVAIYQYVLGLEGLYIFLEPVGIFIAIVLATLIGFLFEVKANTKFEVLNKVNDDTLIKVVREGEIREIPKHDIVVGDTIYLDTGDEIPADCELLEAVSLRVNESTLTGELVARKSTREEEFKHNATYPTNHILRGTTIMEGHAVAKVIRVGDHSEYGKVYRGAQIDSSVKTPLNMQLDKLAMLITRVSYVVATTIVVARLWIYMSEMVVFDWLEFGSFLLSTIMIAVTVIVVSVPEGLPMSVTLSLALSMQRMLKANNLVRKMHACETMGAATVICTDKTGTITQNKMVVYETQFLPDSDKIVEEGIAINSTAHLERGDNIASKVLGNPTEGSLLLWLEGRGVDYLNIRDEHEVVDQLPFSTERKYMATVVSSESEGKNILYVKGAPEIIISLSKHVADSVLERLTIYQNMAMRTIGFAYAEVDSDVECFENGRLADLDLTFLGIVAISDPIRKDVSQAIASCQNAGIVVKIVTGDTLATVKQIANQIGLWGDEDYQYSHMTGVEFESMSDEELRGRVQDLKVLSRARPMDKQRLVHLLQQQGEVVAVTGDGTNDAPALKAAQIGLSMGDGTTVAKEASDITILDNSFNSISRAVMWGRSLYQNIQRFILFQLTINVVACIIVLIGALSGGESPLTVTQMLWVNLIMDTFAALALASLPSEEKVMRSKPRRADSHIITPQMAVSIVGVGVMFVAFLFGLMQYFKSCDITSIMDFSISQYCHNYFNFSSLHNDFSVYELSLFFTIFVMMQFWNMFNARAFKSGDSALRGLQSCGGFIISMLLILVGQWCIVTFGGDMFGTTPLKAEDWLAIIVASSSILIVGEVIRFVKNHIVAKS